MHTKKVFCLDVKTAGCKGVNFVISECVIGEVGRI